MRLRIGPGGILLQLVLCFNTESFGAEPARAPIRLHPHNAHYFLFRGKPTVLVTSGEHYGAVLNLDFDYVRYLDTLKAHGFNHTRAFSGAYREIEGSFGIPNNTLAPAAGRFVCPWARIDTPGASDGGNKFDLERWDPAYFRRLKDFVFAAGERDVVVELVLFCTMYDEKLWRASPAHPANNVNGIGAGLGRYDVYSLKDEWLTGAQVALTRKLVTELAEFDNVYFEICNEPYERDGLTPQWNDRIVAEIVAAERDLPADGRHLIAQGVPRKTRISEPNPHVSVFNVHAATAQDVRLNFHLDKPIADDETGGKGRDDLPYRVEAWEFLLSGGAVFSHLDFSFTCDHPDGTAPVTSHPGGGGQKLRAQLAVLKKFMDNLDFVRMKPDEACMRRNAPDDKCRVAALSEPGKAYALYVSGAGRREVVIDLPGGTYEARWINPREGSTSPPERMIHAGGARSLAVPGYSEDVALSVKRID